MNKILKMRKFTLQVLPIILLGSIFSGCATTELQTQAKVTKSIILDHSRMEKRNIYLQVTNTSGSGGENMNLYSSVKRKLEAKGYNVIKKSKESEYGLFVNVLFANNLREANAVNAGLGAGVTAGSAVAIGSGSGTNGLAVGVAAAIGGAVIGKFTEDEIFRAVIDIKIRDYMTEDVTTIKSVSTGDAQLKNVRRAGNMNQFAGKLGNKDGATDMNSNIVESSTIETIKNYEEYSTRAFVEAIKMNLSLEEALPILEEKASTQIANFF